MPKKGPDATAPKKTDRQRAAPTAPEETGAVQVIDNYQDAYRDLWELMHAITTTTRPLPGWQSGYPGLLDKLPTICPLLLDPKSGAHGVVTLLVQSDGDYRELLTKWERYVEATTKSDVTSDAWYSDVKKLLYEHYGIDIGAPDADAKLLRALIEAHVPAFQLKRALREHHARRAKKPHKLDWKGSAYLFIHEHLRDESKRRPLARLEEDLKKEAEEKLKAYALRERTIRDLRARMRSALAKYLDGHATDFQKQFLELAWPWLYETYFRNRPLDASREVRKAQKP